MKDRVNAIVVAILLVLSVVTTAQAQSWPVQINSPSRFRVLSQFNNQAVLDLETGLVWERSPSTTLYQWTGYPTGHIVCNVKVVGNRLGWRLPTIQELASLADPTRFQPSLPAGHPFILSPEQTTGGFWSATTANSDPTSPNFAWGLYFLLDPNSLILFSNTGGPNDAGGGKDARRYIWCVRGGQGVDPQ